MQKVFFQTRSVSELRTSAEEVGDEIVDALLEVEGQKGLWTKRDELMKSFKLLSPSKNMYKNTPYLNIEIDESELPIECIKNSFEKQLEGKQEFLGYRFFSPIEKKYMKVPFYALLQGTKIFAYSEHYKSFFKDEETQKRKGIQIKSIFDNNDYQSGSIIVMSVPSKTRGTPQYSITYFGVPTHLDTMKKVAWQYATQHSPRPQDMHLSDELKFNRLEKIIEQHEIAGSIHLMKHFKDEGNAPFTARIFPIITRELADIYEKIENNLLIESHAGLRKPNRDEQSIIIYKAIKQKGFKKTLMWNSQNDPKIKNYWQNTFKQ